MQKTVTLEQYGPSVDFAFHFEQGKLVIDECKGCSPEEGLALFPDWALEIMCERSKMDH